MIKCIVISSNIDKTIKEIQTFEEEFTRDSKGSKAHSYSKIVNYLVALGIDRYNELIQKTGKQVTAPKFEFDKYTRHLKPQEE